MRPLYRVNNKVFITGGTGYIGSGLIQKLVKYDYDVHALSRKGSEHKIPSGCNIIIGNALDSNTYKEKISPCETFIHLIGVSNPLPAQKNRFENVDLASVNEALEAVKDSTVKHFIYISVANPAPIMKDYVDIRLRSESLIIKSGLNATFLKPWYVLGPGHNWPYVFLPFYKVLERIPATMDGAMRLALVKLNSMVQAIIFAIQNPANGIRYMKAHQIKKFS
jgi:nucleoside-diphosphate-sugar epimerase